MMSTSNEKAPDLKAMEERMDAWDRSLHAKFERQAMSRYEPTLNSMQIIESAAVAARRSEARSRSKKRDEEDKSASASSSESEDEAESKGSIRQSYQSLTDRVMQKYTTEHNLKSYQDVEARPWRRRISVGVAGQDYNNVLLTPRRHREERKEENRWLVPWNSNNCDIRFIWILLEPGCTGGQFSELALPLSDVAQVYALCLPGRRHRACEAFPSTKIYADHSQQSVKKYETRPQISSALATLATKVRSAISFLLNNDDTPYILFGHGGGAIIAYEIARAQQQANQKMPKQLLVSGCFSPLLFRHDDNDNQNAENYPPIYDQGELLSKRDDIALLSYIERVHRGDMSLPRLKERPKRRRSSALDLPLSEAELLVQEQKEQRKQAELASLSPALRENAPLRTSIAAAWRQEILLMERHCHTDDWPLECPITALAGDRDIRFTDDHLYEWREVAADSFRTRRFPGTAAYFFQDEGRRALIQFLRNALSSSRPPTPDADDDTLDEERDLAPFIDDIVAPIVEGKEEEKQARQPSSRRRSRRHSKPEPPPVPVPKLPIDDSPFM